MSYGYTLLSETFPVARKWHRCIWCGEGIDAGTKYRHEHSVYDGDMQDHKWHIECDEAFKQGLDDGDDPEFIPWSAERPKPAAPRDTSPLLEQANPNLSDLCARLRELEKDHDPEGWPAVQMKDISALLDVVQQPKGNE